MSRVLIIEDDKELLDSLRDFLKRHNFHVETSSDGEEGLYWLTHHPFDVAVIDWELPGLSGVEICSRYRKAGGPVPILMLTGRSSIDDKIEGFESGADDYLPKPFNPAELFARVRALLRRAPALRSDQIVIGDLELDTAKGTVKRGDQNVKVTKTEYSILEVLMKNPGRIFTGEELIERIWGAASDCTEISLRSHIARLRAKFEAINTGRPLPLKNVYGMGYKVEEV